MAGRKGAAVRCGFSPESGDGVAVRDEAPASPGSAADHAAAAEAAPESAQLDGLSPPEQRQTRDATASMGVRPIRHFPWVKESAVSMMVPPLKPGAVPLQSSASPAGAE
jgi:hypothetical protein